MITNTERGLGLPPAYVPSQQPANPADTLIHLTRELAKIRGVLDAYRRLLPQVETSAPQAPQEGMLRIAMAPWTPTGVSGALVVFRAGSWEQIKP